MNHFILIGAFFAFTGVGAGAFGAHSLAEFLAETGRTDTFETAVRYQIYHALALLFVALFKNYFTSTPFLNWSGWLFTAGILIFSGSLYLLILTGQRWLGAVTPVGGIAFLAGWALLFLAAWRS